jgi:hypothetical protein
MNDKDGNNSKLKMEIKLGQWISLQAKKLGRTRDSIWNDFYRGRLKPQMRRVNQRVVLVQVADTEADRAQNLKEHKCECGRTAVNGMKVCQRCRARRGRGRVTAETEKGRYAKSEPFVNSGAYYAEPETPSHVLDMLALVNQRLEVV